MLVVWWFGFYGFVTWLAVFGFVVLGDCGLLLVDVLCFVCFVVYCCLFGVLVWVCLAIWVCCLLDLFAFRLCLRLFWFPGLGGWFDFVVVG